MEKKEKKPLKLNRETIRQLREAELRDVAGGLRKDSEPAVCPGPVSDGGNPCPTPVPFAR